MILDVLFLWRELQGRDVSKATVVVVDVLRATTTMIQALENGASAILPQASDGDAKKQYEKLKASHTPVLLCGEKEGFKRAGYDLGNSPLEFTPDKVEKHTIIHLTTNGTRALNAASPAREVLIASFSNVNAVVQYLKSIRETMEETYFVVSGKEGHYCLEDTVCVGAVIAGLLDPPGQGYELTDSARTAIDLYTLYGERLNDMINQCSHGRYLRDIGLEDDLRECIKMNTSALVPHMRDGWITKE